MLDNQKTKIIWIDKNINDEPYTHYKEELNGLGYENIHKSNQIEEAIAYIQKEIFFENTKIIINSNLFVGFVKMFKTVVNSIFVIPKIIVFTENKENIEEINKNKEYSENPFYVFGGIVSSFDEIKAFITNNIVSTKFIDIKDPELTFEYIDREEKLALQLFYKTLIKKENFNKIQNFTNEIYKKYCNSDGKGNNENKDLKEIFDQMLSMPISNIPIELLSRYYARAYTAPSMFYFDLNKDLRENKKENYLPLVKLFYESIIYKTFKLSAKVDLYRGTIIKNEEITKIENYKNKPNENENLPGNVVFSRTFLSFSKSLEVAHEFLKMNKSDNEFSKVLFILEKNNDIDYDLATHCDIEEISLIPDEQEVLFLPFSPFKIVNIEKVQFSNEEIYEIHLSYLDKKYVKYLENYQELVKLEKEKLLKENKEKKEEEEKGKEDKKEDENEREDEKEKEKEDEKEKDGEKEKEGENEKERKENGNILKRGKIENFEYRKQIIQSGLIDDDENIGDIGYLFEQYEIYKKLLKKSKSTRNIITAELDIYDDIYLKQDIKIINSFELSGVDHYSIKKNDLFKYKNAREIKNNIKIKIDGQKIDFSYSYKFSKKGKYEIEYIFSQNLTKIDYMFSDCKLLTKIDLSNFDTSSVINMSGMFNGCLSLKEINLKNFKTKNVFNMRRMFNGCRFLTSLDLSYFDTRNVIDMRDMFKDCILLISLNLESFITNKVNNMSNMFNGCSKLANLNLSNFDVGRVNAMWKMFHGCVYLKNKNIKNKSLKLLNELKNIEFV